MSTSNLNFKQLFPRKGGGRSGGKGGKGGGGSRGSPASSKGAPKSFTKSNFAKSFKVSGTKSSAAPYSDGGGKSSKLKSGLFSGRLSGGGKRADVYGTRMYGSGYPYGGSGLYVTGRPFPYIFYPVPIQSNYYGNGEYENVNSTDRPGGNLTYAIVQPSFDPSSVTYRIVGDNSSVSSVFAALAANCSLAGNTSNSIFAFTPSTGSNSSSTWPLPEQIIQWYRASSFPLSLDGYNNTAALASNQPPSNSSTDFTPLTDTPLPSNLNATFLSCVNYTIGESVPLYYKAPLPLTPLDISQIIIWGILALIVIGGMSYFGIESFCKGCKKRWNDWKKRRAERKVAARSNSVGQVEKKAEEQEVQGQTTGG